jgi:hypothetical protein
MPAVSGMLGLRGLDTMTHATVDMMPAASVDAVQQHRQKRQTSKKHGHRNTPVRSDLARPGDKSRENRAVNRWFNSTL